MRSHALLHVCCALKVFRSPWTAPASEPGKTWMIRVSFGKGGHHVPNLQSSCAGRTQHIRARKASQCDPSTPLRRRPQRARSQQSQCVARQHRSRASHALSGATFTTKSRPVTLVGAVVRYAILRLYGALSNPSGGRKPVLRTKLERRWAFTEPRMGDSWKNRQLQASQEIILLGA